MPEPVAQRQLFEFIIAGTQPLRLRRPVCGKRRVEDGYRGTDEPDRVLQRLTSVTGPSSLVEESVVAVDETMGCDDMLPGPTVEYQPADGNRADFRSCRRVQRHVQSV